MVDRRANGWLTPQVVLTVFVAALIVVAILAPTGDDVTGRFLSTRSRDINGSHGLREVLTRLGWKTAERIIPFAGSLDTTSTYVILNTPIEPSATEMHVLLEAVRRGANAIVVPDRGSAIADSIGVQASARTFLPLLASSDSLLGSYDIADSLRDAMGVLSARTFHGYLEATPASDTDTVGVWPTSARTLLYVHAKREHSEIVMLPFGRGIIIAIADPTFLRNDVLRKTAGAMLAVRVLENLDSAQARPVVFDEYHQGFGKSTSMTDVIENALTDTPWGRAGLQIGAAALLYLLMIGVRPIPPVSRTRYERRSPLEHVTALSRAYEAISATGLAVQRLVRGVRRRHPLGIAAAASDADYLVKLKTRLPLLGPDIDLLTNALASKPSTEQLVSAGAAIDHIERNLIT